MQNIEAKKLLKDKIALIQSEIGIMQKDTKGYNYTYFDINQLIEKLRPLLEKYNVLVTQPLDIYEGKAVISTIIEDLEQDGHMTSHFPLPDIQDPQKMGSAITYYRRYSLVSLFMLQAEDDDGAKAKPKEHYGVTNNNIIKTTNTSEDIGF